MSSIGEHVQDLYSNEIESNINAYIEHFEYEDAIVLCQVYHNKVRSERSLYLLAKCQFLLGKVETAYFLLKSSAFDSVNCKFLYAKCAFALCRYDECEAQLRDENVLDRVELHPCFASTSTLPFAHSLLAKNLRATNRLQVARKHFQESLRRNCMRWSDIKDYCDVGGERIAEICSKALSSTVVIGGGVRKSVAKEQRAPSVDENAQNCLMPLYITTRKSKASPSAVKQTRSRRDKLFLEIGSWFVQLSVIQEHLSRFRCAEALVALDALGASFAKLPLALELRARVYFESGEYPRCCDTCEELRRLYPRYHQAMEIYSTSLWQLQDKPRLSALCAEMVSNARDEPESWCVAGNCFSLEKQHDTAIECLERATRLNPRFGYAYALLGHELSDLRDYQRAESAYRRATVCTPNDYRPWYGLGMVFYKAEKLTEAKANLLKAIEINPNNIVVLCQLSVIEQSLGNNERAMMHLERALQFTPNNPACLYNKARLLFDTERYEESMCELKKLMSLSPDEANVFYLIGRVYRRLGDHHMALLSYSWATEIDPRGEQNQSALSDQRPYDDDPVDLSEAMPSSLHNMSDSSSIY